MVEIAPAQSSFEEVSADPALYSSVDEEVGLNEVVHSTVPEVSLGPLDQTSEESGVSSEPVLGLDFESAAEPGFLSTR